GDAGHESSAPDAGSDAASGDAGGDAAVPTWATYAEAQEALEPLRFPGPRTAAGSRGACTDNHFVWRDPNGALHSWSAATQSRTDYTIEGGQVRPFFAP